MDVPITFCPESNSTWGDAVESTTQRHSTRIGVIDESETDEIIGAAIEVHRHLGPGLLESVYEECFCHELKLRGISFQRQMAVPVVYKGVRLACDQRVDVLVDGRVVVELKAVEKILPVHTAQLLTYMRLTNIKVGLLLNFNVPRLVDGLVRRVL
jgi:GxxExxY protein